MPLPIAQSNDAQFAQQLALYRQSEVMSQLAMEEPASPNIPWDEFKNQAFSEYLSNSASNAGALASSVVRANFLKTLGIGHQRFGKYNPLSQRIGSAVGDIFSDTGGYMYKGTSWKTPGQYSNATNAMRWFVPMANDTRGLYSDPTELKKLSGIKGSVKRGTASLGYRGGRGRITAGIRSYLGWNWMLGNPADMSFGEHIGSLAKHIGVSYGLDFAVNKLIRTPGKLFEHLTSFSGGDFLKQMFGDSGTLQAEKGLFSQKLQERIDKFNSKGEGSTARQRVLRAQQAKRIRASMSKEISSMNMSNKNIIYSKMKEETSKLLSSSDKNAFQRGAEFARRFVRNSKYGHTGSARGVMGFFDYFSSARQATDEIAGKGIFRLAGETTKNTYAYMFAKGSGEKAVESFGALSTRLTRNMFTIGGMALRVANITSGALAVAGLGSQLVKYRDNLRKEYIRNMTSDSMAYSYMPEMGMSGTERTRAIEAIQNSSMGLRNFLGQEGAMVH